MTEHNSSLAALSGRVDFNHRRVATIVSAAGTVAKYRPYPPFEMRFLDGFNYIEIDSTVRRPAALLGKTQWIAYRGRLEGATPIPDRAIPPSLPIDILEQPRANAITAAHFLGSSSETDNKTVAVRFRDAPYKTSEYTYTIDSNGRIAAISVVDQHGQGTALEYTYSARVFAVVAPTNHVQRLAPGASLYPTSTTATAG